MPGGGFGELTPQQEFLLYRYNEALEEIRRLEPDNPTLQVLRDPNTPPGINEVLRFEGEVGAARARAAAGRAPRGSAPPRSEGPRVEFNNWDEPTPEQEAIEATKYGRTREEYADLARDPAQGGKITPKTRMERKIGLESERAGVLRGPITRDPDREGGEFIDADGQSWDVKGFVSNTPTPRGRFNLEKSVVAIREEIDKGEKVILDTSKLTAEHADMLRVAIEQAGLAEHVRWWP
jgi:hypothetical protein